MTTKEAKKKLSVQNFCTEKDMIAAVIAFLTLQGYYAYRVNNTGVFNTTLAIKNVLALRSYTMESVGRAIGMAWRKDPSGKKGLCDVMGFHQKGGSVIGVEIKIGKDVLSDDQITFIASLNACGAEGYVCRDFGDFVEYWKQKSIHSKQNIANGTRTI